MDAPEQLRRIQAEDDLKRWRLSRFRDLGFTLPEREYLEMSGVDWHEVERWLGIGASRDWVLEHLT
jgi:hypothetical protein